MERPVLVILAAGMGSRYGGLKQIDPVDAEGHKIIDFSVYDAIRAGFEKVIFIIKKEHEEEFRQCVGNAMSKHIIVEYAYQEISSVPVGCTVPIGRTKPLGTAHALYCCKDQIQGPFAVINADDFYGKEGYQELYDYLMNSQDDEMFRYTMVAYRLGNTLTDHGTVSRGCCTQDEHGYLKEIVERTKIRKSEDGAQYWVEGDTYAPISMDTLASMNMWGFSKSMVEELEGSMNLFFEDNLVKNPSTAECFLPFEVDRLLKEGKATVKVLQSKDKWFGITYQEDKPMVEKSIRELKEQGIYPQKLWD
ncbi:MAG: sugar phosphate nucleotidyltransferase [Eubacteriales bacterium]